MRRRTVAAVAAALVVIGGGVMLLASSSTVREVLGLAAEGGEMVLREPMRPAGDGPRVLVLALDGVGEDELLRAIRGSGAPNIQALLGPAVTSGRQFRNGYAVPGVLSVLPSTTIAAWSSLFTGEPPARTGVPGNEWFAREEDRFYAPAPVSVTDHEQAVLVYTEGLVGAAIRVPTVYERANVRSYVSLSQVHRGADLLTTPEPGAIGALVSAVARGVTEDESAEQEAYQELDEAAVRSLIATLEERGIPDLQVVYFPGIDLYTHVARTPIPDERAYLRDVIDRLVGEILAVYRSAGVLDDTYVVIVSDHGHTPVLADDRHALGVEGHDEPTALIEAVGFRMRPPVLEAGDEERDYQAAVAYQGAMAYVYLADRSGCPASGDVCDWSRPPRLEEDVLPIVRAFDEANRTGAHVPQLRGTLDLILAREPRSPTEAALPFQIWDGFRLVEVGEYLAQHPRPDLLDLETRLNGLAAGPYGHRAGDVLLLARSGADRPIEDRYYFSGEYRSWHGSPSEQDSRIPLLVARAGVGGAEIEATVRAAIGEHPSQLDVTSLLLALLEE